RPVLVEPAIAAESAHATPGVTLHEGHVGELQREIFGADAAAARLAAVAGVAAVTGRGASETAIGAGATLDGVVVRKRAIRSQVEAGAEEAATSSIAAVAADSAHSGIHRGVGSRAARVAVATCAALGGVVVQRPPGHVDGC